MFLIPVGTNKRWLQFWKKDESEKAMYQLMDKLREKPTLGKDVDFLYHWIIQNNFL